MSALYIYSTPKEATVSLALDSGQTVVGKPCTANGRDDAHEIPLPPNIPGQGAVLTVSCDGYHAFSNRGILEPYTPAARFVLDDVRLEQIAAETPEPTRDPYADPLAIINDVYGSGGFDLATKEGCGEFTEACAEALYAMQSEDWGHIRKKPEQNNWEGHAVDAIMLRWTCGNTQSGGYDIIHDSVSDNAKPCFNWAGPADDLWAPVSEFA